MDQGALLHPGDSRDLPGPTRPTYSTVQTMVYRLEAKKALRRIKKISNAFIFEAAVSREAAERKLITICWRSSAAEAGRSWRT